VSALDGVALALVTAQRTGRMTRFLVAAEFFEKRRFGWALRLYRQIPVHRGEGDADALNEAIEAVRAGALAGIFPEGRVNTDDPATLQRGHTGVARIALAADAPVIPAGIWGTQTRYPHTGLTWRRPFRPTVAIAYGEPLPPSGDAGSRDDVVAFTERVMAAIESQVAVARRLAEGTT
jgi:1-acyl-sn-glycerol-3-phosphate acyltransferase